MTYTPMFQGQDDRARVLSDIISFAAPQLGVTLIALVHCETLEVQAVHTLVAPEPMLYEDEQGAAVFDDAFIHRLNLQLHDIATELAPPRAWTGSGWSVPTHELITVVCRGGEAELSEAETQFWWGWRYSNHLTNALDGDVYAVTPAGWVALVGEWAGATLTLPSCEAAGDVDPAVREAEQVLAAVAEAVLVPRPGECLLCYVARMLDQFGCYTTLRFARRYRDTTAPRATALEKRLGSMGGYCDCDIFLNGYQLSPEFRVPEVVREYNGVTVVERDECAPDVLPSCLGARAGSTRPCGIWERQRRGWR